MNTKQMKPRELKSAIACAERQERKVRKERRRLEDAYHAAVIVPARRKLIGNHYRNKRSFAPLWWWVYITITGIDADGHLVAVQIQKNGDWDRVQIEQTGFTCDPSDFGCEQISAADFHAGIGPIVAEVLPHLITEAA